MDFQWYFRIYRFVMCYVGIAHVRKTGVGCQRSGVSLSVPKASILFQEFSDGSDRL
jgi:hypothetical protein